MSADVYQDRRLVGGDHSLTARIAATLSEDGRPQRGTTGPDEPEVQPEPENAPAASAEAPEAPVEDTQAEPAPVEAAEPAEETPPAPEEPKLTAPASFTSDEKARFDALPRDQQEVHLRLEQGRLARHSRLENEAAEQRKAVEAEVAQAKQRRDDYAQRVDQLVKVLEQQSQGAWANVDWVKLSTDQPAEYVRLKAVYEQEQQAISAARNEQTRLANERANEEQQRLNTWINQQADKLVEAIPEWRDEKVGTAAVRDIHQYLRNQGFAEAEVARAIDARQIIIARKAMLYDQAQARLAVKPASGNSAAASATKAAPTVQKPGAARAPTHINQAAEADRRRFAETGKVQDAAAVLKRMMF